MHSLWIEAPHFLQSKDWECKGFKGAIIRAPEAPASMGLARFDMNGKATCMSRSPGDASSTYHPHDNDSYSETSSVEDPFDAFESKDQLLSIDALLCILQKCSKTKNLAHAKHVHVHICYHGLENTRRVINYIVPMFVECGSALNAQQAVCRSAHCNEYSWTSLIQGFIERGDLWHAFNLYQKMQDYCVQPSEYTFVALLKACARQKCMEKGQELHTEIAKRGLESDPFLGNTLVGMYAKCGAPLESQEVFGKLSVRDVVSWNALMAGYSEHGLSGEALDCIERMHLQGVCPDYITYTCSLKACGSKGAIERGQNLHGEVIKKGIERDAIVCSTLVDMYAKCGALAEACEVFNELPVRDAISWNALMAGYAENGLSEEVLNFSNRMQEDGVSPDASTYVCSLKACGTMRAKDRGQEIHIELVKKGCENDHYVGSTLMGMYAKCSSLAEAHKVFDELPVRDLVCWTTLIAGYAEHGLGEEALVCFEQMQVDGTSPCALLFACTLKACCSIEALGRGRELHAEIVNKGFERDSFIGSTMVDMYAKCGSLAEAQYVFDNLLVQDAVLWTALITGYVEHGFGEKALKCLEHMQLEGVSPDAVMLACSLKACGSIGAIDTGRKIHAESAKLGFERDGVIGSTLVDMYGKCGSLTDARKVFEKLLPQDVVSWNAMIAGYANHGLSEEALFLFHRMQVLGVSTDVISWNSIILGYTEQGESKMAFMLFAQMQEQGLPPNDVIFLSILKACGNMSSLDIGKRIHAQICSVGAELVSSEANLTTILIEMYSKCGNMIDAQELFNAMTPRHVRMWDALIRGYARQAEFEVVFSLLKRMRTDGIQPDEILFLNVLNVCSHLGLVDMGEKCFQAMSKDYGITPTIKHHTCMVDLLGRAGRLDEAVVMIEKMPLQPNLVVWSTMLDACRKWGNVELGRWAFECAVRSGDKDPAPFILMSNIYADAGMYDAAKRIKALSVKLAHARTEERLGQEMEELCLL